MKIKKILKYTGIAVFAVAVILTIWEPVFPSRYILQGMTDRIDVKRVKIDLPVVLRFYLSGKGGGVYNIIVDKDGARLTEGDTDRIDFILKMEAAEFNSLMYSLATGKASPSAFVNMAIAKRLSYTGEMSIMKELFSQK